jgi:hypothetical protein
MAEYRVTGVQKDADGDIVALCGDMGKTSRNDVRQLMDLAGHRFYVLLTNNSRAYIDIVRSPTGWYLRTNWDGTTRNNLDSLPPC